MVKLLLNKTFIFAFICILLLFVLSVKSMALGNCIWSKYINQWLCYNSCTSSPCKVACTTEGGENWCVEDGNGWANADNGSFCSYGATTAPYTEWCPDGCTCIHKQPNNPWVCFNGCIQAICPTDPPITVTPPPPTCADLTLTISGPSCSSAGDVNKMTFTVSGSLDGHSFNDETDSISGVVGAGNSVDLPGTLSIKRDLIADGNITWQHSWRETNSAGVSINCTESATKEKVIRYLAPTCGNANPLSANPLPIYNDVPFTLNHNVPVNFSNYVFLNDSYSPNITCGAVNPLNESSGSRSCNISAPGQTQQQNISWTHNWKYQNKTCTFLETPCNATFSTNTKVNPGYLVTVGGDAFVEKQIQQIRFNTSDDFSTYTFGSGQSLSSNLIPAINDCQSNGLTTCSKNNYLLGEYNDANSTTNDWFTALKDKIKSKDSPGDNINIIESNGMNVDAGTCNEKSIYIVNGDLQLTPRYTVANKDSSCLFLVSGTTTITNGGNSSSTGIAPEYSGVDLIEAFIITGNYADSIDGEDLLVIKGGLIVNNRNFFNRNIKTSTMPSTIIHYEGARYIKNFGSFLTEPQELTIKELHFN